MAAQRSRAALHILFYTIYPIFLPCPAFFTWFPTRWERPSFLPTQRTHPLESIIPRQVQAIAARLDYFVAENAKTTRAFLKLLGSSTALAKPIQEIQISELNVNTPPAALPACWRRCWKAATVA
jgi:hypothetical protein